MKCNCLHNLWEKNQCLHVGVDWTFKNQKLNFVCGLGSWFYCQTNPPHFRLKWIIFIGSFIWFGGWVSECLLHKLLHKVRDLMLLRKNKIAEKKSQSSPTPGFELRTTNTWRRHANTSATGLFVISVQKHEHIIHWHFVTVNFVLSKIWCKNRNKTRNLLGMSKYRPH